MSVTCLTISNRGNGLGSRLSYVCVCVRGERGRELNTDPWQMGQSPHLFTKRPYVIEVDMSIPQSVDKISWLLGNEDKHSYNDLAILMTIYNSIIRWVDSYVYLLSKIHVFT